jgi:hypothetical protein
MKLASTLAAAVFLASPVAAAQSSGDSDDGLCLLGACAGEAEESPTPRPEPIPPEGRYETTTYLPLTVAGACTFGAAWIATIALASASVAAEEPTVGADGQERRRDVGATVAGSFVPVAGPVVLRSTGGEPRDETIDNVLVVLMGVQAIGLLATFLGATIDSRVEIPATAVVPTVTPNGAGVVAVGRF